jgi:asparagine synthase (glutamine-hydrolysing)
MCGICGELAFDSRERVTAERLAPMRAALAHRGPDRAGLLVSADGRVGLGFQRLRIVDLSAAADQPMGNEDGRIQIVFNGEIYNFRELRAELVARGHRFQSHSDTETIVHLYEDEGVDAVRRLEGMFAIAIWDGRQRRLVLARDRAGKKPLFVYRDDRRVAFASEIKAFFAHPALSLEIDPSAIPEYFAHGNVPTPHTFYRGVEQVPPATVMVVDERGAASTSRYWTLPEPAAAQCPPRAEARATVARLVTEAVERRLISDVPLGAFLSGGLDSTIVVGVMSRILERPVKTFSIGFERDAEYDETSYARAVAVHFGTDHTEFRVTPSAIDLIDPLIWYHDGPFGDSSALPTYLVAKLTREHVTVALSGDGGDELFAGYLRFQAAVAAEFIPRVVGRGLRLAARALPRPVSDRHLLSRAHRFARFADLPLAERLESWTNPFFRDVSALLAPEFRSSVAASSARGPRAETHHGTPLDRALRHNFSTYLPDDLLVKADRCSMANALEVRSPFLDRALTEYVTTLPDEYKMSGRRRKVILREAFADLIPPVVLGRGKMGFGVPLARWFSGELRTYVADVLLPRDARYRAYLSGPVVEDLVHRHLSGRENLAQQLWTLLCFERWLQLLPRWRERRQPVAVTA